MKVLFLLLYINFSIIFTQISHYGYPHYISEFDKNNINIIITNEKDVIDNTKTDPLYYVFGKEYNVDIDFFINANKFLTFGGSVYLLQINSPNAKAISLEMNDFYLAPGLEMFIYNIDKTMIIGAFTSENNKIYNAFSTSLVKGEDIIIEVFVPFNQNRESRVNISKIIHDFKDLLNFHTNEDLDRNDCNINVACPQGDPYRDQVNSVMLMTMGGGSCSASLINNVEEDFTPYVLTAQHCLGGNASNYNFYFKYQSNNCNGSSGSYSNSMSGAYLRSDGSGPDFALLELTSNVPESYDPYYNGWSRYTNSPDDVYGIHHAGGDIKKISFTEDNIASTYNYWEFEYDEGRIFPGSSGSPLFDQYNRTIGPSSYMVTEYCNGWNCYCDQQYNVGYGKLYRAWDYGDSSSNRLRDWLDPSNTDVIYIDGISNIVSDEINVLAPNGGESWEMGSIQYITWSDNLEEEVSIKLYKDNIYVSLIVSSTMSDGNYEWTISEAYIPSDDYKIKITSLNDPSIYDISGENFSITGIQGQVVLNINEINIIEESIDIVINNTVEISGFQFKIIDSPDNIYIEEANGGISEEYNFMVSSSVDGTILGFTLTGDPIPSGENLLTKIYYTVSSYEEIDLCLENAIFSSSDAIGIPVSYGDCIEVNLDQIILGDINFDDLIDIFDVIILINEIIDPGLFDSNQFISADFNYDNILDILDIIALVNVILD